MEMWLEEGRTGLDAVDGLVGALRLVLLLGDDRGDGAAGPGVLGYLLNVLNGGWLRHCRRLFVEVWRVVMVDVCCLKGRKAD